MQTRDTKLTIKTPMSLIVVYTHLAKYVLKNLTLKVVSESCVMWATFVPILVFLSLSVLELGPMYATDRQTDRRQRQTDVRQHHRLMPPRIRGVGIITMTPSTFGAEQLRAIQTACQLLTSAAVTGGVDKLVELKRIRLVLSLRIIISSIQRQHAPPIFPCSLQAFCSKWLNWLLYMPSRPLGPTEGTGGRYVHSHA